jgi:hypothetical protein
MLKATGFQMKKRVPCNYTNPRRRSPVITHPIKGWLDGWGYWKQQKIYDLEQRGILSLQIFLGKEFFFDEIV